MPLQFHISTGSDAPIFRQLVDQVRKAVATGTLVEGDQLPSVRTLAEQVVVNPNTVARAYTELVREGVVEAQRGKGLFVAKKMQIFSAEERHRRLEQAIETFLSEAVFLDFGQKETLKRIEQKWNDLKHPKKE